MNLILLRFGGLVRSYTCYVASVLPILYIGFAPTITAAAERDPTCMGEYNLYDPGEIKFFVTPKGGPFQPKISINGTDLAGPLAADHRVLLGATTYLCLKNLSFIVGDPGGASLLSLVLKKRQGKIRILDVAFYGNRTLLDLVNVRGKVLIMSATFAKARRCVNVPYDATVTVQKSTMYNCAVKRLGKVYKNRRILMSFKKNRIYLLEESALRSYLALARKGKGRYQPRLTFVLNKFWVRTEKNALQLAKMLDQKNVRCMRNKIFVAGPAASRKTKCAEIVPMSESDRERLNNTKSKLAPVRRAEWLFVELVSPRTGHSDDRGGTGEGGVENGETGAGSGGSATGMIPFRDGTFFSDGTGWRAA